MEPKSLIPKLNFFLWGNLWVDLVPSLENQELFPAFIYFDLVPDYLGKFWVVLELFICKRRVNKIWKRLKYYSNLTMRGELDSR